MRFSAACFAAAALAVIPAHASEGDAKPVTQQSKFATCAHESKGLRGEEHQKFMSECLRGHDSEGAIRKETAQRAADETGPQHNRMRTCNEQARNRDLHGDERRAFMSSCLKG